MSSFKTLLSLVKPYWKQFIGGFAALLIVVAAETSLPMLAGKTLFDEVFQNKDYHRLVMLALGVILLYFVKGLFAFLQNYLMSFVGYRVVVDLRTKIYRHLQKLSIRYHETHRTGELMARITNDVGLIQSSVSATLADLIKHTITLIVIIILLLTINWRLTLVTSVIFPLGALLISKVGGKVRKLSHQIQEKIANLTSVLQESLVGIRVVKAFTMEEHETKRFIKENEASFQSTMGSVRAMAFLTPTMELLFVITFAFVIWYAGSQVIGKHMTSGTFMAFLFYIAWATTPLSTITNNFNTFQHALAAIDRVFSILNLQPEIQDKPDASNLPPIIGQVEFKNVSFAYQENNLVLKRINLTAKPGEIVALVGPSGSGKTSLVSLIPRFYDTNAGNILVDGYDIKNVKIKSLRDQIGLVPQESLLFGVSIRENIAYGKPVASLDEIIAAAKAANAHDFILALPDGYNTLIGERGASLSGGQRQRISIARAILRDPRILILDEATSALDTESERLVQEALEHLMRGRTTFVIAHRLSTVQFAHKIAVLEQGRIVEEGSHEELMARNGLYRRLYDLSGQFDMKDETNLE